MKHYIRVKICICVNNNIFQKFSLTEEGPVPDLLFPNMFFN